METALLFTGIVLLITAGFLMVHEGVQRFKNVHNVIIQIGGE